MLGGLFCYYLSVLFFRGCFLYLWSVFLFLVFGFTPSCICISAGIGESETVANTDIVATTVKWAGRLHTEPCCFGKSMLDGFNFALCHVCMLNRSGGKCECGCSV